MLDDLRVDAQGDPLFRALYLGRDGPIFARVAEQIDPAFHDQHCRELYLPRLHAERMLRELEHLGHKFPQLAELRKLKAAVGHVPRGIAGELSESLTRVGIPEAGEGRDVEGPKPRRTILDSSYGGSIQETVAAVRPNFRFHGRYAIHVGSPSDPHPDSKTGYEVHLMATEPGSNVPLATMPDDPALTFTNIDALRALESVINGTYAKSTRVGTLGPVLQPLSVTDDPLGRVDEAAIAEPLQIPVIREATKRVTQYAVADLARIVRKAGPHDPAVRADLADLAAEFRTEVRKWVLEDNPHEDLKELLDSLVKRTGVTIETAPSVVGSRNVVATAPRERLTIGTGISRYSVMPGYGPPTRSRAR